MANIYGASAFLDAFIVAFKIPNFFRRIFAEGVISQVFLPHFSALKQQSKEKLQYFLGALLFWDVLALSIFFFFFFSFLDTWLVVLAPGFADNVSQKMLLKNMMYWTMPYLFFTSCMAIFGVLLNTHRLFSPVAIAPIFLNLSFLTVMISGLFFEADIPEMLLAFSVFVAGFLQLGFMIFFVYRIGFCVRLYWMPIGRFFKSLNGRFWFVLIALSMNQLNLFIDIWMASFLENGSISWLYYADRLLQFPVGIFSVALSTIILAELSLSIAEKQWKQSKLQLNFALEIAYFIGLPCSLGLFFVAQPIISTLFGYGQMSVTDVTMSANALSAYALGLFPFIILKLLINVFHAYKKGRVIAWVAFFGLISNIIFNIIFIKFFAHVGLAIATSISAFLSCVLLGVAIYKNQYTTPMNLSYYIKCTMCLLVMSVWLLAASVVFEFSQYTLWWRLFYLFFGIIMPAVFIYMGLAFWMQLHPMMVLYHRFKKRGVS